jgi:hypothetical protein
LRIDLSRIQSVPNVVAVMLGCDLRIDLSRIQYEGIRMDSSYSCDLRIDLSRIQYIASKQLKLQNIIRI